MPIKTLLIFPPGWVPFAPYLALPALKGYLEHNDIEIEITDLNAEYYDYTLSPEFLNRIYKECLNRFSQLNLQKNLGSYDKQLYQKLAKALLLKPVISNIDDAKRIIRSQEFFKPKEREKAKNTLIDALYLVEAAYEGLSLDFNKVEFKYSKTSTKQILKALEDRKANPFIEFYEEKILNVLNKCDYDLIGFSVTGSSQLVPALTLAKLIKDQKRSNNIHVTFGGNFITRLAKEWETYHPFFNIFDSLVVYEGEKALHSLIEALEHKSDFSNVP
ncbi:hypothetical protein [Zhaonella formicivorans]|uniref:hypothetical protein n=1 Tax=Zhaonella formicivorans TaxID=2528593 RepID=UPI0010EC7B50|nr:hypothetical protein [Zhaonella formicivorans]